jgi:hypothetical protein
MVRLAEADVERLAELVTDAWRMRAPAALAGELGEAGLMPAGTDEFGPGRESARVETDKPGRGQP